VHELADLVGEPHADGIRPEAQQQHAAEQAGNDIDDKLKNGQHGRSSKKNRCAKDHTAALCLNEA
jgi:hypothetical protein